MSLIRNPNVTFEYPEQKRLEKPIDWWREKWIMRMAAVDQRSMPDHVPRAIHNPPYISEADMSMLKNANSLLAGLHVIEAVTDAVVAKHAKGEHFTFGDLANVVESNAVKAVTEAGIADHPWKMAPARRGGRPRAISAPKDGEDTAS